MIRTLGLMPGLTWAWHRWIRRRADNLKISISKNKMGHRKMAHFFYVIFCRHYPGRISMALIWGFSAWGVKVMVIILLVTVTGIVSTCALNWAPEAFHGPKSLTSLMTLPVLASPSLTV